MADLPHCNYNFKVAAQADCWVYNAENVCVSFLTKLHPFFTWEGGKQKRFGKYLMFIQDNLRKLFVLGNIPP